MTSIASGIPGIEVPHLWNGAAYLNDRNPSAHVKLTRIERSRTAPDAEEPNQGRKGSYAYPTSIKSSAWTYTGVVRAKTLDALRVLSTGLESAFRDRSAPGLMTIGGAVPWIVTGRVKAFDIPDEQKTGMEHVWPWQRDFALQILLLDPRGYALPANSVAQSSGNKTLTNAGSTDSPPVFTLNGFPGGSLTGQNNTLGTTLTFTSLPAGNVVVDFLSQKLTVNGADYSHREDPASNWWDENVQGLIAGANVIGWTSPWGATWFHAAEA